MSKVDDAVTAVQRGERARDDAAAKLAAAQDQLDAALAEVGWKRLIGAFDPGATPLYTSLLYPNTTLTQSQVLEHLEQQRKAAAAR